MLIEKKTYSDLINKINAWMSEAEISEPNDPNAACLATSTKDGRPSARMVLVKEIDSQSHIVFYTNHTSRKAKELIDNPYAALTIHWKTIGKQVRIEGQVDVVTDDEADAYFASRSRGSRISAWASDQSSPLESRDELESRYEELEAKFDGEEEIPRPSHWSGFRIIPTRLEFWEDAKYRLHHRELYERNANGDWQLNYLNP